MDAVPLRIAAADWDDFRELHGRDAAAAIRQFIAWSLRRPGAAAPVRPAAAAVPRRVLVPPEVFDQFSAWYLRMPGAGLPARPRGVTAAKTVRLPPDDWREFVGLHGDGKASEAVKMFIAWSLRRPGAAALPVRPAAPGPGPGPARP